MQTEQIVITSKGRGIDRALEVTEETAQNAGLDKKPTLHLRLLAEEMFGMLRGIAGNVEARYWIEYEGKAFRIRVKSEVNMTEDMREQFLGASSNGKNAAAVGFMGKLKVVIADMMLASVDAVPITSLSAAATFSLGYTSEEAATIWSLALYREEMKKQQSAAQTEAWDELEKSIVANIADDIKVGIIGRTVDITVYKSFI